MDDILEGNDKSNRYDRILNASGGPYDQWLNDMASRPGAVMHPMEFDSSQYPEQQFSVAKVEAHDPYYLIPDILYYPLFRQKWVRSLGGAAVWNSLSDQIRNQPTSISDNTPIMERTAELLDNKKNIMVVTSHFSFEELGYFKALRFVERHDRSRMSQIGTVVNKIMARQSLGGKPVIRQFAQASNAYFSYPKTASSDRFGVPPEIVNDGNSQMLRSLIYDLKRNNPGHEIDIALTGKQITPKLLGNGIVDHYEIPEIDTASASLVKLFDYVYGATMIKSPVSGKWELSVGDLIDIKKSLKSNSPEDIVDQIYIPIVKSVEKSTGIRTIYMSMAT